jgi:hypothetical protein
MSSRSIPVSHECAEAIPQHRLQITAVNLDEIAVRVEYRITPGIEDLRARARGSAPILWQWAGTDDLGNEYEQCGGAYGRSRDGQSTEGVLSLRPLPPEEARRLHVLIYLNFKPELGIDYTFCEFDVDLGGSPA